MAFQGFVVGGSADWFDNGGKLNALSGQCRYDKHTYIFGQGYNSRQAPNILATEDAS